MKALPHFTFPAGDVNHVFFTVTDSDQKQYNFRLAKRNKGDYPKPAITGDWLEFVHCKDLKEGDEVTLYGRRDEAGTSHYTIEVKKMIIKLFGTRIY
ncbi:hypothetical protein Pint_27312 [Pistacia integerrima]|uniref:Uncharacterized protein n=2 Tax=Pistacia integerrima TaxID=434235 RepID=A0ACC0YPR1_9ROSI|nr:hypothetical protein Pint_27313 [Pistacia integerrima]KAJ0040463.1 hypothetical protein Pint_27312 [Pistacia integerrima]